MDANNGLSGLGDQVVPDEVLDIAPGPMAEDRLPGQELLNGSLAG